LTNFVHLHNHTDFSLLDGAAPIERYVEKAQQLNMKSLAITDHGNLFGALRFYSACKEAGINPIVGCECYSNPKGHTLRKATGYEDDTKRYHLVLLAMNETGYRNLLKIVSIAYTEGFYKRPRIDDELLKKYNEGLICLSACLGGEILQLILNDKYEEAKERALWHSSIFDNDRYYLEIQDHGLDKQKKTNPILAKLSKETNIPLVCTNDIHYIEDSDWLSQDVLLCIGTGAKLSDEKRMRFNGKEFYFKSQEQMSEIFKDYPQAIENTSVIANRCNLEINFPGPILPESTIPEPFKNEEEYLIHLSREGLKQRYNPVPKEYADRLEFELKTIIEMKFPGYFLIVSDYIYWAREHNIPVGPGRGSGAGSIVAYSLGITNVDPMKYNLLFERFLNPDRVSMPDFDIDFCQEGRADVIEYVTQHYGADKVSQIATFGTLKTKAVIKDCARVLDIPFAEANRIAKFIPEERGMSVDKALEMSSELHEIQQQGGVYETLFAVARRLEGLSRHISTHAAGVVIGKEKLTNYVPLYKDPKTGAISTEYTMDLIEECGLVKMDFLGLKTLTLIKHCVDLIHKKNKDFNIDEISETDEATFKMLQEGKSACVFQFESPGMQKTLKQAEPSNIEDLVALNALYRPGPMSYIKQYVDCKHGRQPITYADPALEDELKTTYGVIVYQEQVMKVAQIIAGYSLGEADILRRLMSKKKVYELEAQKKLFIEGAAKKGHSEKHAIEIFEMLEPFANYGFNKSHAVAYSLIAYQTAFLKANYPAEFLAANLTNEMNNPDKFKEYLNVAENMGLEILPPFINYSDKSFSVVDNKIVYGLAGIKNVGEVAVVKIIEEREKNGHYISFMDFLQRSSPKVLNSKLLESLIVAGAFDLLKINRPSLLEALPEAVKFAQGIIEDKAMGQMSLFEELDQGSFNDFEIPPVDDWKILEKLEREKELLGYYISGHPLDIYKKEIRNSVIFDLSKPKKFVLGQKTALVATLTSKKEFTSQAGKKMSFLTLTDANGSIDSGLFNKAYEKFNDKCEVDTIYGFVGKFKKNYKDEEKIDFDIEDIVDPKDLPPTALSTCNLKINYTVAKELGLKELKQIIMENSGPLDLNLIIEKEELETIDEQVEIEEESPIKISCNVVFNIRYSDEFISKINDRPEIIDIWFN